MGILSLLSPSAPPSVRRPAFEVSFGSDDAAKWKNTLVSLTVESALAPAVDVAEVRLAAGSRAPSFAVEDTGTISLGFDDDATELLFSGQIDSVNHSIH